MTPTDKRLTEIRARVEAARSDIPWLLEQLDEDGDGLLARWKRQYLNEWGAHKQTEKLLKAENKTLRAEIEKLKNHLAKAIDHPFHEMYCLASHLKGSQNCNCKYGEFRKRAKAAIGDKEEG